MEPNLLRLADTAAPRYTSYPTAQVFSGAVGADAVALRLGALGSTAVSLYVHVPFCRKLCWFCGCHTSVANDDAPLLRYAALLEEEIDLVAGAVGGRPRVAHLHWGGGTPTILPPDQFRAVMARMRAAFPFAPDAELATEIDPRTLSDATIEALAEAGINRVSLGVQDFNPHVQAALNRVQPVDLVRKVVRKLRDAGIGAINLDLMYGLPRQSLEDAARTAAIAADLGPDRVAVFGYAHVPWFAKHQKAIDEAALPGLMARFRQAETAADALVAEGYVRIGLDHFALPGDELAEAARAGTLRRNFQGYTTDPCQTLVAMGPSAISAFRDGFAQNAKATPAWKSAIDAGQLPTERGCAVSADDRLRARAIEALMCNLAVDLAAVCEEFGVSAGALDDALPGLRALSAAGLCALEGRRVELVEEARMLVRNVAQCFDAYSRADAPGRHAKAV